MPFVQANQQFFNFDSSFMSSIESLHKSCGYEDFTTKYLKFPPPGIQPHMTGPSSQCDVFNKINSQATKVNPCFNIYEVNQTCPTPSDQLSGNSPYFNRADVKQALHAPSNSQWSECSNNAVFTGGSAGPEHEGDVSLDSIQKVLPQVITATNRVLVANGDYDMIIITNGTLLSIQNMTWGGALGFQSPPVTPINIPSQGQMGIQHYERGLMWAETYKSGHMVSYPVIESIDMQELTCGCRDLNTNPWSRTDISNGCSERPTLFEQPRLPQSLLPVDPFSLTT